MNLSRKWLSEFVSVEADRNITDISPLRDLTNLQNLLITEYGDQKITDWSPVDHVPNVTKG